MEPPTPIFWENIILQLFKKTSFCEEGYARTSLQEWATDPLQFRPGLLEAWLVLTSVKYHGNLYILIPLNQRLALTRLRATGPCPITFKFVSTVLNILLLS